MDRARRAGLTAFIVVVMVASLAGVRGPAVLAGVVGWPPSTLVVSEVQTGGTSASDEFVEIADQGAGSVDLLGLEVIYATSSGSTVTRKATWSTSTILGPGQRFLLGNSSGVFGSISDATYAGGFAATGGAIALRVVGGAVIDAIGWGDATNAFVEGSAAAAPPAGSSLERGPGGAAGNMTDTNDNANDWFVQAAPSPQGLTATPIPGPGTPSPTPAPSPTPTPTATPTPDPTATPTPTQTASTTPTPSPASTPEPTQTPSPTPTLTPTPTPTPAPTPTPTPAPTPTATPTPTPTSTPTPTPAPTPIPIADARVLPDGDTATIEGVLTTALGALESGRSGFIQDASGGIALYLDEPVVESWPAGTIVRVDGIVASRFSQRTLRVSESALQPGPMADLPTPRSIETGAATEAFEGVRVAITGIVVGAPDQLTDGLGVTVDDGSGPVRTVIGPDAASGRTISSGMTATVIGPLGQRDSSGTGSAGYRVQATLAGELLLGPTATPIPTPVATPSPTPVATPSQIVTPTPPPTVTPAPTATPTSTPTPMPTPTPAPSPTTVTIGEVRTMPIGTEPRTTGVVVAEAGRLGSPALLAIADATGGVVVHLPAGAGSYARGTLLEVAGKLAAPYGQLEVRPVKADLRDLGTGTPPTPLAVGVAGLTESTEGRLVTATGRLTAKPTRTSAGVLTIVLKRDGASPVKVMADPSSRVAAASVKVGSTYRVVGFVGQRASRSGALDGYRIWVRDAADIVNMTGSGGSPSPTAGAGSPSPTPGGASPATVSIARALRITDRVVAIDAVVTTPATLLDSTGRRIVVQDGSGAIEVLLPTDTAAPPIGARVRASGRIGVAYDAPRLRADGLTVVAAGSVPVALVLHGQPGIAQEWRLVTVTGRVDTIHKLGDRWRAELIVGGQRVVVVGEAGAGIPSSAMVQGRSATVVGIARRPFPSATDRRFAVIPRFPADVRLEGRSASEAVAGAGGASTEAAATDASPSVPAIHQVAPDADLVDLDGLVGATVRVGGLVTDLRSDGFTLDDGTATGRVVLRGPALDVLSLIEPDDALEATGRVEASPDGAVLVVDDPAGIIQASDPAAVDPLASPTPESRFRRRHSLAATGRGQPVRRPRRWPVPVRSGDGGARDAARHLGCVTGLHGPPSRAAPPPHGGPDRRPAGHLRRALGGSARATVG